MRYSNDVRRQGQLRPLQVGVSGELQAKTDVTGQIPPLHDSQV